MRLCVVAALLCAIHVATSEPAIDVLDGNLRLVSSEGPESDVLFVFKDDDVRSVRGIFDSKRVR